MPHIGSPGSPVRRPDAPAAKPTDTTAASPNAAKPTRAAGLDAAVKGGNVGDVGKGAGSRVHVDALARMAGLDPKGLDGGAADLFGIATDIAAPASDAATPAIETLYGDARFKQLHSFVTARLTQLSGENRGWDQLWQIRNFVEALSFVTKGEPLAGRGSDAPLFAAFTGDQERRAIAHLLMLLMPEAARTEQAVYADGGRGARQMLFSPLPDAVIARADNAFALGAGDLPSFAPIFTRHLAAADLPDKIFKKGQEGIFLASKRYCPGAFLQDRRDINPPGSPKSEQVGHEGDPIFVRVRDVVVEDGKRVALCAAVAQHRAEIEGGRIVRGREVFGDTDVVVDTSGKPLLGPDGQPQAIRIPVEHLADYLLDPGNNTARLNFADAEDRALALTFSHTLRGTYHTSQEGVTKSLFDWLAQADAGTSPADLDAIKEATRQAAWQSVARHACHPRRTHFKIDRGGEAWQEEAFQMLQATGIMQDCGNRYEKDKSTTHEVHEMAWTGHFLSRGFVGGSLDCYGLARAYDRLGQTFLAPLGILSTTDLAEGHGSELNRVLSHPDANGVVQVGVPLKSKLNEMIVGIDARLSSGRGPAAQYMENWPGYLKISPPTGQRYDFAAAQRKLAEDQRHAIA